MLIFKKIRFKNLLGFGNQWTDIDLESKKSVLIQGQNGVGKSACILDSLCFALYGKPFRKVNKPVLVNFRNKKDLVTEVWFSDGKNDFHIIRGLSPSIFEIYRDGVLIDQNSKTVDYQQMLEDQILKIDFHSFTQIVLLGKATYVAFLRLKTNERRKFIENVLGLSVFSQMSEINKSRISGLRDSVVENKNASQLIRQKEEMIKASIDEIERDIARQEIETTKRIESKIAQINEQIVSMVKDRAGKISSLIEINHDIDDLQKKLETCYGFQSKLESKLSQSNKKIKFFQSNDVCPTCDNVIDPVTKESKIKEIENKRTELEDAYKKLEEKAVEIGSLIRSITDQLNENRKIQESIRMIDQAIRRKNEEIVSISKDKDIDFSAYRESLSSKRDELIAIKSEIDHLVTEKKQLAEKVKCHEYITAMLKDSGIRSLVIKSYIPKITKIMNEYLKYLGLFSTFSIDENFDEKLMARGFDPLPYNAFSEGQKLRIDLAMLMTWRDICAAKNSMIVNFLVFDEILDASLDENGSDSLVSLFKQLERDGIKIIVISHNGARWEERFSEMWAVKERDGFSYLEN